MRGTEKIILLVEDNPDDIELTMMAFRKNNIQNRIEVAKNGCAALNYLRESKDAGAQLPSLILLDLNMPGCSGFEVLEELRKMGVLSQIPVIILSSSSEALDVSRGYELGANSYLRKPVSFAEFMKLVREMAEYWLNHNELPTTH